VRILVAEPDPDVLVLVERALAAWGHEPVRYRPGAAVQDVDVMVVEPAMGARVVRLAAELSRRSPAVPLVVVSIHPSEPSVRDLRPVVHLLKPFALRELEAAVRKAVTRAERARRDV
jgi:DNA-binding response OmpR family regulator